MSKGLWKPLIDKVENMISTLVTTVLSEKDKTQRVSRSIATPTTDGPQGGLQYSLNASTTFFIFT